MDNKYKICIKEHIDFFNNYLAKELFDYFHTSEVQDSINSRKNKYMCKYIKQHFLKTYNLLVAVIILAYGNPHKILLDESKIVFRSLFENILNFIYIFSFDDIEKQDSLIEKFYDFAEISINQYSKKFLNSTKDSSKLSKEEKLIYSKLQKDGAKDKIKILTENFYKKYNPRNKNTWSGKSITELFEELSSEKPDWGMAFYKKYYDDTNPYVHCNILEYFDEDGFVIENKNEQDLLELIHKSIFLFFGYTEALFQMLIQDFRNKFSYVYDQYEKIDSNYHTIQKEDIILQI